MKRRWARALTRAAMVGLVLLAVTMVASAKPEMNPGTNSVFVPPSAFGPVDSNITYSMTGRRINCTAVTNCYFYAPVELPLGVRIKRVVLYVWDAAADVDATLSLWRFDLAAAAFDRGEEEIATVDPVGLNRADWVRKSTREIAHPIVRRGHSYFLSVFLEDSTDLHFGGAKIVYED